MTMEWKQKQKTRKSWQENVCITKIESKRKLMKSFSYHFIGFPPPLTLLLLTLIVVIAQFHVEKSFQNKRDATHKRNVITKLKEEKKIPNIFGQRLVFGQEASEREKKNHSMNF